MTATLRISLFLIVLFSFSIGCQKVETVKTMTFEEIYPGNLSEVSKVEIRHGGGEVKTITDKATITDWLDSIKDISFIHDENQEKRVGYLFYVKLFAGEELKLYFDTSSINDYYYLKNEQLLERIYALFNERR
ncbi:hypothetical protein H1D32_11605 [Anaerobacillus sp. CMMVII]|uniref:hypothetical protein n=1 Tax=Anaerobacillus sp. CMMVII TaxID=2755588 RepID=UPI0021B78A6B|nr:hypothetical protein [Anaerobacillus sp. CMMVII]MCT8138338.1 hypothetical protein [Anaerobacillus sp. CMMVII]